MTESVHWGRFSENRPCLDLINLTITNLCIQEEEVEEEHNVLLTVLHKSHIQETLNILMRVDNSTNINVNKKKLSCVMRHLSPVTKVNSHSQ